MDEDGSCRPEPTAPSFDCEPGHWEVNGACVPAGVPADGCAPGFTHDGDRGCEPTLPAERCPPGQMAVVGDASCRDVADCGSGPWGDIPVEANSQYVDGSYTGGSSDGSAQSPWTTIGEAIAAAEPDAVVAIAAGSYPGPLTVSGKAVRLWGRCPSMVDIDGGGSIVPALRFSSGSGASEVHQVAIHAYSRSVSVAGGPDAVLLDRLWIYGNGEDGIEVSSSSAATLRDSLVEDNLRAVSAIGDVVIERSVLRKSLHGAPKIGGGLFVIGTASVTGSVLEDNENLTVFAFGGDVSVDGSVLRGAIAAAVGDDALTIAVQRLDDSYGTLLLTRSLLEPGEGPGVLLAGTEAVVETTVFRDSEGPYAGAVHVQPHEDRSGVLEMRQSLIERTRTIGAGVANSRATFQGVAIRDVLPDDANIAGRGLEAASIISGGPATELNVEGCLISGTREAGIYLMGGSGSVHGTAIEHMLANPLGEYGRGIQVEHHHTTNEPSTFSLQQSRIGDAREFGVAIISSTADIADVEVFDISANDQNNFGDGIVVGALTAEASATLGASYVHDCDRAGVSVFGATVAAASSVIGCSAFALDGEPLGQRNFAFHDGGAMWCGCGEALGSCQAVSAGVSPPTPFQ
jgi:hypothetical protein